MTDIPTTTPLQITVHPQPPANASSAPFWTGNAPNFKDFLDTINPLQHIPIVASAYQSATGDVPSPGAKLAGGALFGGPIGFMASLFDSIVQSATGADTVGNIMAAIEGKPVPALHVASTQTADASSASGFLSPNQRAAYNAYVHTQNMSA
jgi:hypothetical protein